MSLKDLELQVQQLPKPDLVKFSEWFDGFREASVLTGDATGGIEVTQKEEVLRRQAEYLANPSIGVLILHSVKIHARRAAD